MPAHPVARNALDAFGTDAVCEQISDGQSLTKIAAEIGVSTGSLLTWIAAEPDRSARVASARQITAWYWDEQAEHEIRDAAPSPEELSRARELASHFRWRAKMVDPTRYNPVVRQEHTGADGGPIQVEDAREPLSVIRARAAEKKE